ncbi:hypothetical protein [Mycobacterium sp.]|uniref:hypothetical protein n=1 Tax=Mycobacterium sp. TaxID=1785 RepID=UPI002B910C5C|nr:hypothetical protein [Mycobacterium sp.]HKP43511.1 hypothetical protein [Mycobacterium sp.]
MVIFYIGAGIGLLLAAVYLVVGALSFLRIRRELLNGTDLDRSIELQDRPAPSSAVALVPGFGWKASIAVLTSFVALVTASYSGVFWYVLALSGLGTAAAVIVAFVLELRNDRALA